MHSACTPAALTRDTRGCAQPSFTSARPSRAVNFEGNDEPSLHELMDDDVVRRVMARDGVQPDQVWSLMDSMRNRLR
ncbi:MAG: hypothetical protein NVV74_05950 [Magnetospirillum sp.]|nr:hypothetical protein [Magnetospirillum sp.]